MSFDGTASDGHAAKGEGPYVAGFTEVSSGSALGGRGNFARVRRPASDGAAGTAASVGR